MPAASATAGRGALERLVVRLVRGMPLRGQAEDMSYMVYAGFIVIVELTVIASCLSGR